MLSPNRRNLKVWVQSLRSYTGSTRGHSSWTDSSRACSSWTGSSRVCSSWTGSRIHSLRSSSRAYNNCTGSSHKNHSPPWSPHRSHSPPWSPHKSHRPPWSPHRSHSWSRNRLAHSSTRACSSRQAHSSWSHSPHSQSHSPHSRSHSLQSSHSSPWFWWIEGGVGRGAGDREVQVWSSLSRGPLYTCPDVRQDTGSLSCDCSHYFSRALFFSFLLATSSWLS
nr:CLK4-associating serine/arginine rich protein-like [Symphalangus syndactylus]